MRNLAVYNANSPIVLYCKGVVGAIKLNDLTHYYSGANTYTQHLLRGYLWLFMIIIIYGLLSQLDVSLGCVPALLSYGKS